jgi:hypothetical protein
MGNPLVIPGVIAMLRGGARYVPIEPPPPRVGQRVVVLSFADRIIAPGVLLRIDGDDLIHDCAPIDHGYLVEIARCYVFGEIAADTEPGHARRLSWRFT